MHAPDLHDCLERALGLDINDMDRAEDRDIVPHYDKIRAHQNELARSHPRWQHWFGHDQTSKHVTLAMKALAWRQRALTQATAYSKTIVAFTTFAAEVHTAMTQNEHWDCQWPDRPCRHPLTALLLT
eukprot:880115-Amphidinium_carterae.1